jgi:hypothetical protein
MYCFSNRGPRLHLRSITDALTKSYVKFMMSWYSLSQETCNSATTVLYDDTQRWAEGGGGRITCVLPRGLEELQSLRICELVIPWNWS